MKRAGWISLALAVGLLAASASLLPPAPGVSAAVLPPGGTVSPDLFTGQTAGTPLATLTTTRSRAPSADRAGQRTPGPIVSPRPRAADRPDWPIAQPDLR